MLKLKKALVKYPRACKVLLGDIHYQFYVKELKQDKDVVLTVPQLGYRALLWLQGREVPSTWRRFPKDPLRALLLATSNELKPKPKKETNNARQARDKRTDKTGADRRVQQSAEHVAEHPAEAQGGKDAGQKGSLGSIGGARSRRFLRKCAARNSPPGA